MCEKYGIIPIKLVLLWLGNYRVSARFLPPDQLALGSTTLMADHHVLSHQANHLPANTSPPPALHQFHGHGQRVAFLIVLLIVMLYSCIPFRVSRTLAWLMTSRASIGRSSLNQWLCKVKRTIYETSMYPIIMRHTTTPHYHMYVIFIGVILSSFFLTVTLAPIRAYSSGCGTRRSRPSSSTSSWSSM